MSHGIPKRSRRSTELKRVDSDIRENVNILSINSLEQDDDSFEIFRANDDNTNDLFKSILSEYENDCIITIDK